MILSVGIFAVATFWLIGWSAHRVLGPTRGRNVQSDWVQAARFVYVFSYLVIFIGLNGVFVFGGQIGAALADKLVNSWTVLGEVKSVLGGKTAPMAPIFSLAAIHLGLQIKYFNNLDREVLEWLHSTEQLNDEMLRLQSALESQNFEPSDVEVARNREKLQSYDVRIADNALLSSNIAIVTQWRKVACLLRALNEWQQSPVKVLSVGEEATLRALEETDRRKTAHAFDIIKAIKHAGERDLGDDDLPMVVEAGSNPRAQVARARGGGQVVEYLAPRKSSVPLEINTDDLANCLVKIQNYFIVEYGQVLRGIAHLAAKAIVYSGDEAEIRLQKIKNAGYRDLGEMNRLTIDNIVKLFCASLAAVLVVFLIMAAVSGKVLSLLVVWKIGFVYAFAILCGAMIGSNRTLARRPHTPWFAFIGAGVMSFMSFVLIQFAFAMGQSLVTSFDWTGAAPAHDAIDRLSFGQLGGDGPRLDFFDVAPWAIIPAAASIAICWISRLSWGERSHRFLRRCADGALLAVVFAVGMVMTMALHITAGTEFAGRIDAADGLEFAFMLRGTGMSAVLGFLMGTTAIEDIRQIAKSKL